MKIAPRPGALEVREVEKPTPGPGEALVQVAGATLCGSDLHIADWDPIFHGFMKPPMVLGHEFAGVVVEAGTGVTSVQTGMSVVAESVISCGSCSYCREGRTQLCVQRQIFGVHRPGGMAEMVIVPAHLLHQLPPGMPVSHAAIVEPTVVALHAVLGASPDPGDVVLVIGPGPVGLLVAQCARAAGADVYVAGAPADRETRLALAQELGMTTLDPGLPVADALRGAAGRQAHLVFECSGSSNAVSGALAAVATGGSITLIGLFPAPLEIDLSAAIRREVTLRTSYIGGWNDFERAIGLLADGTIRVERLFRTYPLDDALQAFDDARARRVLKPLLIPAGAS